MIDKAMQRLFQLGATGIGYGTEGVPWLVPPEAFPIMARERDALEQVALDGAQFLEAVHDAIVADGPVGRRVCATIGADPTHLRLTRAAAGYASAVPLVRPDVFWDVEGRLTAVEIETMIGGLGMCEAMRVAYGRDVFPGTAAGYARMVRGLAEEFAARRGRSLGETLTVVAVNPASKAAYDLEFQVFARPLAAHGIALTLARPDSLRLDGDALTLEDGSRIDVVHRFFRVSELARECPSALGVLMAAVERGAACLVQPWKELLDEKALFACFHDPSLAAHWANRLGADAFGRLSEALPKTWVVGPENRELVERLMGAGAKGRPYWLKKSGSSWGGRQATDGPEVGTAKWQAALTHAYEGHARGEFWILQERRVCRPANLVYIDGLDLAEKSMNLRYSPFCFHGPDGMRLADVLVTGSPSTKVHGGRGSVMVPTTVV